MSHLLLSVVPVAADPLPDTVLGALPTIRVRSGSRLLDEGQQCRICLQSFTLGQSVRTLPCRHKVKLCQSKHEELRTIEAKIHHVITLNLDKINKSESVQYIR